MNCFLVAKSETLCNGTEYSIRLFQNFHPETMYVAASPTS